LPVIKFSGACKIFARSKSLGWERDAVRSNENAIFFPPRKRKAFGNHVYIYIYIYIYVYIIYVV
jgi:hypothetical protein